MIITMIGKTGDRFEGGYKKTEPVIFKRGVHMLLVDSSLYEAKWASSCQSSFK